jgi:hypothetical protein
MIEEPEEFIPLLILGDPGVNPGVVAACRSDATRDMVDAVVLPDAVEIQASTDELPQHPMILFRTYDNVQILLDPDAVRFIGNWLMRAADWLEAAIEQGDA